MDTYKIVRKYRDGNHPDNNKVIKTGLSLEEAQEHCKDPETREAGVWFDCYYEEDRMEKCSPSMTKALNLMYGMCGGFNR
jgi:hypothetical protein